MGFIEHFRFLIWTTENCKLVFRWLNRLGGEDADSSRHGISPRDLQADMHLKEWDSRTFQCLPTKRSRSLGRCSIMAVTWPISELNQCCYTMECYESWLRVSTFGCRLSVSHFIHSVSFCNTPVPTLCPTNFNRRCLISAEQVLIKGR